MESGFLTFILASSFAVYSSHIGITEWDDVVVAREDTPITLVCTDPTARGAIAINWMVKLLGVDAWKLVLSVNEMNNFSGDALKPSMRLTDVNFQDTGVFSLSFLPKQADSGLYLCLVKEQQRKLKERTILLAILTVKVVPAAPIPQNSTLRLIASVTPDFAITKIAWEAPGGISLKSERERNIGTVAKVPEVQNSDNGTYVCMVHPWGNSSRSSIPFSVDVIVDADKVASFTDIRHGPQIFTATQAQTIFLLTCPSVQGDYVRLNWQPPDIRRQGNMKLVFHYNRWNGSMFSQQSKKLQLAGPPYNAESGSFSFLLTPWLKDGGLYICEVSLDDVIFSQKTLLSVLKVASTYYSSNLELRCQYSERSQVRSAKWEYHNKSRRLDLLSNRPGSISTILPTPITSDVVGNYTCTLLLTNGQVVSATQIVTLPSEESVSVTAPSLLPSLSALLLLVPLVAAAVGVLLWRQKHGSDRGVEQSLSVRMSEGEGIYENPEDIRQAPPKGSVYMDLKPRGEDDVYKELER